MTPGAFQDLFGAKDSLPPDVYELWDFGTEMTARVCWKPWMYSDQLPHLLGDIRLPTLIVWGSTIVWSLSTSAGSTRLCFPVRAWRWCRRPGHFVDLEEPDRLAELVEAHVG